MRCSTTSRPARPRLQNWHSDDFGSGYSTYHFLNLFRPEYIKIEGTFVRRMLEHESDHKIVQHIHELAMSFGAQTIAESVENEATRAALERLGIRNAQGMHLGSPRLSGEYSRATLDTLPCQPLEFRAASGAPGCFHPGVKREAGARDESRYSGAAPQR